MAALALTVLVTTSFLLHLLWERIHIRLYTAYDSLKGSIPVFIHASLGDVLYTLLAIGTIAVFKGDVSWFVEPHVRDYLGLAIIGFGIALFVEYKAMAFSRWKYTDEMPIIPFFRVGLSPIAQMIVLLPLSVFITSRSILSLL